MGSAAGHSSACSGLHPQHVPLIPAPAPPSCPNLQEGQRVVLPGEGVSKLAKRGRPDISAYLRAAAADSGAPLVGVFAGGPAGLMQTVHLAVAALNDRRDAGVYFELHNEVRGGVLPPGGAGAGACMGLGSLLSSAPCLKLRCPAPPAERGAVAARLHDPDGPMCILFLQSHTVQCLTIR